LSLPNAWSVANYNASPLPTGGDTVFFSGTITNMITPSANGTGNDAGRLTLDMSGATMTPPIATFSGNSFITLLGGAVAAGSNGATLFNCSLPLTSSHDITISNFSFTGIAGGSDAFVLVGGCSNLTVSGNTMDNIQTCVNEYQGSQHDITVLNNFCRTSVNTSSQTDVISLGDTINVIIQGNKLVNRAPGSAANSRHNDVIQTFRSGSSQNQHPSNWIIRYNWIEAAQADGSGGNMSFMELENFAGQPALKIYGNIFVGTGGSWSGGNGISLHSGTNASDTYFFYNNTVVRHLNPLNPLRLGEGDGPGSLFMRNNIAFADTTSSGDSPQITFAAAAQWNRNFFFNFGDCTATHSGPNGSCSTNPLFVDTAGNDFSLQSGSSLINAGDDTIGAEFNQGIALGATWPNPTLVTRSASAWDVGAFQSGGGAGPDPPTGLAAATH
jgi:hypothetical protein